MRARWSGAPENRRPAAPGAPGRGARAAGRAAAPIRAAGRPARRPARPVDIRDSECGASCCRCPPPRAPRSSSSRAITSTSLIRGTLVSTHSSVGQQARGQQRQRRVLVAFDFDRIPTGALAAFNQERGHECSPVAEVNDLLAQRNAEPFANRAPAPFGSAAGCPAAVAEPRLTMKLPWAGDTRRRRLSHPFRPARSTSAPGRPRNAFGHAILGRAADSEKCSRRFGVSSGCVRLRKASDSRAARTQAPPARPAVTRKSADNSTSPVVCRRLRS